MYKKIIYIIFLTLCCFQYTQAQIYTRMEAGFSIKEIGFDGTQNLMTGTVFFNQVSRQVIYDFDFPEKRTMIINDTCTFWIEDNKISSHQLSESLIDFSVFNLFLNQNLDQFGLTNTPYILTEVEEADDMILSTWELPSKQVVSVGKLIISQKKGNLYGLATLDTEGEVLSKQFFLDYKLINDLPFPTKLIQISYHDDLDSKKVTTYRNIKLNSSYNEDKYTVTPAR